MVSNLKYDKDEKERTKTDATQPEFLHVNPYRPYELESGFWTYHKDVIERIKKTFDSQSENRVILLQGNPGLWKSAGLKRFEKSPEILGKNFIPIYLDSREYIDLNVDYLLFSISKDVIEKLNQFKFEFEHEIPKPEYIKGQYIKGNTLESFLLTVDSCLSEDEILVLIFDKLECLMENINVKIISDYIRYFKHIEKKWSKYGLILAVEMSLVNLTNDETVNQFLGSICNIEIEEMLEEEDVRRLIVEPVKNQLAYENDAIERIIWYSGKNLYFQQLICYELIDYLNERGRKRSLIKKEDIEQAIERIVNEKKIKEFGYIWEKKLSVEARLIVSALADESVTEKRENFYFLKENRLLTDILGERIYNEIEKVKNFGYIKKMKNRCFPGFPFKAPLLGKWIQKKHPFIKTVFENIETSADKIDLDTFIKEVEKTPENKMAPLKKGTILKIAYNWCAMTNSIIKSIATAEKKHVERSFGFLEGLSTLLNLNMKGKSESSGNYFIIDIENLNIGILGKALCFIQDRPELTREDITNIENVAMATALAQYGQTRLTLFFYSQENDKMEEIVRRSYLNLIAIAENDLKRIIFSERPEGIFKKIILSKLSLQKISPYQTAGPAKANFYGRSDIINQITRSTDTSYAIVGARKIGKSSLLHKLKDNPPPNTAYIFMDLEIEFSNVKNYKTFLKSLEIEIERVLYRKVDFSRSLFGKNVSKLPEIIKKLSILEVNRRIVFILDEIDSLIEFDKKHNYKLMHIFRVMSQKNYCQFIFAGFKELYHSKRDIENPMYNFCEEIKLEPLDREAALDLITKPMGSIGVHYKNKEDREIILKYTASHPNLIQFFCKHLVEKIEKHKRTEDRRTILKEDIEELFNSAYEDYIMDEVYMFFSDLSDINKLILVLFVEEQTGGNIFSEDEIRHILIDKRILISRNDLHRNLRNLVIRFILVDIGGENYRFALPVFRDILGKRVDKRFKNNLIKEIRKIAPKSI
jgi:histone H3/H4